MVCFGILLATASAQTGNQTQTPPVNSTTSATGIGSGAQTTAGTPVPASGAGAGQVNPTETGQTPVTNEPPAASVPSGAQSTSGGVAGSAASSATQNADIQSNNGIAAMPDFDLQTQIQNALSKEPTLAGDSPHVTVTPDAINLAGSVSTGKAKVTATRIVQSYAGNKKVVNHLQINGRNDSSPHKDSTSRDRSPNTENPATNPEPNKGSAPVSKPPLS